MPFPCSALNPPDGRIRRRRAAGVGREPFQEREVIRVAEEPDGADCDDVENRIATCAG